MECSKLIHLAQAALQQRLEEAETSLPRIRLQGVGSFGGKVLFLKAAQDVHCRMLQQLSKALHKRFDEAGLSSRAFDRHFALNLSDEFALPHFLEKLPDINIEAEPEIVLHATVAKLSKLRPAAARALKRIPQEAYAPFEDMHFGDCVLTVREAVMTSVVLLGGNL